MRVWIVWCYLKTNDLVSSLWIMRWQTIYCLPCEKLSLFNIFHHIDKSLFPTEENVWTSTNLKWEIENLRKTGRTQRVTEKILLALIFENEHSKEINNKTKDSFFNHEEWGIMQNSFPLPLPLAGDPCGLLRPSSLPTGLWGGLPFSLPLLSGLPCLLPPKSELKTNDIWCRIIF